MELVQKEELIIERIFENDANAQSQIINDEIKLSLFPETLPTFSNN